MQAALAALGQFDRDHERSALSRVDQRGRAELFAEAAEQVWTFMIRREAMKLPYYEEIFSDFAIPEEVRRKMGPKNWCLTT